MRIQYEHKRYTLKEYDHIKNKYTMPDGSIIKRKDIEAMILSKDEIKDLFDKKTKTKEKIETVDEVNDLFEEEEGA